MKPYSKPYRALTLSLWLTLIGSSPAWAMMEVEDADVVDIAHSAETANLAAENHLSDTGALAVHSTTTNDAMANDAGSSAPAIASSLLQPAESVQTPAATRVLTGTTLPEPEQARTADAQPTFSTPSVLSAAPDNSIHADGLARTDSDATSTVATAQSGVKRITQNEVDAPSAKQQKLGAAPAGGTDDVASPATGHDYLADFDAAQLDLNNTAASSAQGQSHDHEWQQFLATEWDRGADTQGSQKLDAGTAQRGATPPGWLSHAETSMPHQEAAGAADLVLSETDFAEIMQSIRGFHPQDQIPERAGTDSVSGYSIHSDDLHLLELSLDGHDQNTAEKNPPEHSVASANPKALGIRASRSKLTEQQRAEAQTMLKQGVPQRKVAEIFGVSQPTISYLGKADPNYQSQKQSAPVTESMANRIIQLTESPLNQGDGLTYRAASEKIREESGVKVNEKMIKKIFMNHRMK